MPLKVQKIKLLLTTWLFLLAFKSFADCTVPAAIEGTFRTDTAGKLVEYCDGTYWLEMDNGTPSDGNAGCSLITALTGQLVYTSGAFKSCFIDSLLSITANSMKSTSPVLISPPAVSGVAGKLIYHLPLKEPVFHDGTRWHRTRKNPITLIVPVSNQTFISPYYQTSITFRIWGGGGGGASRTGTGANNCTGGANGGSSIVSGTPLTLTAGGGGGGGTLPTGACSAGGAGGTITNGGAGSSAGNAATATDGPGKGAPLGGGDVPAGANGANNPGQQGSFPGGGGSSSNFESCFIGCTDYKGRGGGSGGYITRTYGFTGGVRDLPGGTALLLTVGAGGAGGNAFPFAGPGNSGRIEITWD